MSELSPIFQAFDPERDLEIHERNLPHWFQAGVAIFVSFRTADSLPKEVMVGIQRSLGEWLRRRSLPPLLGDLVGCWQGPELQRFCQNLDPQFRRQFQRRFGRLIQHALDECHGRCLLKDPQIAKHVYDGILHGNGLKFDLDRFVIMPNHVHAIVQFRRGFDLKVVGQSWMRYTARQINKQIGESGAFWQAEPFDHIIRSREQFLWLQKYIAENPAKANLRDGEFQLWLRPE